MKEQKIVFIYHRYSSFITLFLFYRAFLFRLNRYTTYSEPRVFLFMFINSLNFVHLLYKFLFSTFTFFYYCKFLHIPSDKSFLNGTILIFSSVSLFEFGPKNSNHFLKSYINNKILHCIRSSKLCTSTRFQFF